jgi:hypothetical protein
MSTAPNTGFRIRVDVTNPGQFFACCGLFELANRLVDSSGSSPLAYFDTSGGFHLTNTPPLATLIERISNAEMVAHEPDDRPQTALTIGAPFDLRLDWWRHESRETGKLKTWAGQMSVLSIALDMRRSMKAVGDTTSFVAEHLLASSSATNEGEPFYFDACRALNANRRDVGFSVDALKKASIRIKTLSRPAVEFLCLVGLQRARPRLSSSERRKERTYVYHTWGKFIPAELLPAAIGGYLPDYNAKAFLFTNPSRAKDYRAFMPATPIATTQ